MDRTLSEEAADVLASAGALVREWLEEGVDTFEHPESLRAEPSRDSRPLAPGPKPPSPLPAPATDGAGRDLFAADDSPSRGERPSLEDVRDHLGECTRCGLCEGRKTIVFGDGNPDADLMFVGEGPGEQEDRRGLPFVGRAGELLTQMIERGIEIPRSEVYICNIVKCRPPRNRTPLPDEVRACRPFLDGQIDAVRPRVIVSLGKPAASLLLGRDVAITRIRGTWHEYRGIPLMPTLHPAFVLRQYTEQNRRAVWEDLKAALARSRSDSN